MAFQVSRGTVQQTHNAMRDEILSALEPVLFGSLHEGKQVVKALEQTFGQQVKQPYVSAVHSATVGLFIALRACGVGSGDEVITIANADVSTTAAISQCGATPVLCDVLVSDFTIDVDRVESLITERTAAVLPVDLYGHPADVKRLRVLADAHGLSIIEDAALALGAYDYGEPVGAFADITVFSFAPFKPLGCVGNGGMVVTHDGELAERIQLLTGYGHALHSTPRFPGQQCYEGEGFNVPLDPLQAALLTIKLPHLVEWTEKRRTIAATYAAALQDAPVVTPKFRAESIPTFRCYTLQVDEQQQIYHALRESGVEAVIHYSPPMHHQPVYQGRLRGAENLPITDRLHTQIVSLPVAVELRDTDVQFVIDAVLRAVGINR